ncbi:MAG: hypothetical protein IPL84_05715 [Chitinophagaceae bacterium]|nr:hypothetical protein [Chitinophagaceae bacterium]
MPIIQRISRFLQNIQVPFTTVSHINRQKRFIKKNITPQLTTAQKLADGSLDESDIKKITGYYGLAVPAILGEAFCALRGEPMTNKERIASTNQGAMTGLGDDFFDRQRLSEQGVKDFIEKPEQVTGNSASEKLFLGFYKTALANAPGPEAMQVQIGKVFEAQLLSKQQDVPGLSHEVIKDITVRKGAESLLYYRTAFKHPMRNGEEKMLYCLGGLMQLSNDIFDVYKDHKSGVSTLVTTATKIEDLRFHYSALLELGQQAANRSGYAKKNVRKFLGLINIAIFSRCYVCLDQLERNEKKSNGVFDLDRYQRKELICDMDTVANKLRSLRYHLKISK